MADWRGFLDFYTTWSGKSPILLSLLRGVRAKNISEDPVVILCGSDNLRRFLEKKKTELEIALSAYVQRSAHVQIETKEGGGRAEEGPLLSFVPAPEDVFGRAGLQIKNRFDNYAVSGSNNIAFAAAQAVAKNPGTAYNPLFLYGGVGVGKTHLAQAAAHAVLEMGPERRVMFCPGDRFTNELIESIQNKSAPKFRKKYRALDLLVVDDIQFIAGKQTVQEEFFHTFNSIVSAGGQIILTSDRPPQDIKNLEDRLRSRFSGGLIVDVLPPDFELKTAILLIKAKERGIGLDIDAAKVIADNTTDVRALEGALLSIYARVATTKSGVSLEDVESLFVQKNDSPGGASRIDPGSVIRAVCTYYGVRPSQLKSAERSEHISLPRHVAMYILRRDLRMKYEEIATVLKRKDHTTIMHGYQKISSAVMKTPSLKSEIDRIVQTAALST